MDMEHDHYCTECQTVWSHEDPTCPRALDILCPACQAKHPVLSDNEPWETPEDLDEQMIRDFEAEGGSTIPIEDWDAYYGHGHTRSS